MKQRYLKNIIIIVFTLKIIILYNLTGKLKRHDMYSYDPFANAGQRVCYNIILMFHCFFQFNIPFYTTLILNQVPT